MCALVEIAMVVFGVLVLATGTLKLTRSRVVNGFPARLIAVLMMVPLPFNVATIFVISTFDRHDDSGVPEATVVAEMIVTLSVLGLCLLLGVVFATRVVRQPSQEQSFSPNAAGVSPPDPDNPYASSGSTPPKP